MPPQDSKGRVKGGKALSHSDISQQHKLLNHEMRVDVLVFRHVSRVLTLVIQLELELWGC